MSNIPSSIKDNHKRGSIGDFLKQQIEEGNLIKEKQSEKSEHFELIT